MAAETDLKTQAEHRDVRFVFWGLSVVLHLHAFIFIRKTNTCGGQKYFWHSSTLSWLGRVLMKRASLSVRSKSFVLLKEDNSVEKFKLPNATRVQLLSHSCAYALEYMLPSLCAEHLQHLHSIQGDCWNVYLLVGDQQGPFLWHGLQPQAQNTASC